MICPSCQARIAPETIFCPRCGTEIGALAFRPEASAPGMPLPSLLDAPSGFDAPYAPPLDAPPDGLPAGALLYVVPVSSLARLFGPRADPDAPALTRAGALVRRAIPRRHATNLWVGGLLGALVALGLGLALMLPVAAAWARLQPVLPFNNSVPGLGAEAIFEFWTLFHVDPVKLLLFAEHVPLRIVIGPPPGAPVGAEPGTVLSATPPLLGLLLLPALGLVVGGYLSASTLAARVPRYALARGALIGPFYGAALFALAAIAAGRPSHVALGAEYYIAPRPVWALFYGTLWGVLFGALGGWIAVSGRAWLFAALATLRARIPPRVAGALAGAGVALGCGLLLAFALEVGAFAFVALHLGPISQPLNPSAAQAPALPPTAPRLLADVVTLSAVLGPPGAVWLFALGPGASWNAFTRSTGGFASPSHGTFALFGAPAAQQSHLWLLLALIPLIGYLIGGRVAARIAGAHTRQEAFLAGATLALPLAAVLALLAQVVAVEMDEVQGGIANISGLAPSVTGTFLAVLIGGAVVGGIGGLSVSSIPAPTRLTRLPLVPPRLIGRLCFAPLDRLTGRDRTRPLSLARRWFYDGVLAAILFGALAAIADLITAHLTSPDRFARMELADSVLAGLLLAVPLLCFGAAPLIALLAPAAEALPAFDPPAQPQYYALLPAPEMSAAVLPRAAPETP